jgi:CheY-like chemotaxis protein
VYDIDVQSNRKMLEMILRRKGFSACDQCVDGREAVQRVQTQGPQHYDLIFMDSVMPDMVSAS